MKIALLIQNNLWFCPYVKIYTDLLDLWGISYDKIYWNRDNSDQPEGIPYNGPKVQSKYAKLIGYFLYSRFIRKIVTKNKYDKIIVFSPQIGIFISKYLSKYYRNKYILDYRDLSIEQNPILQKPFQKLLENSYANVISSPGFKKYLPKSTYVISHNFDVGEVKRALVKKVHRYSINPIEILTIGGIRDFESNCQIIEALSNKGGYLLKFVGRGPAKESLEKFSKGLGTNNIIFEGFYKKENEANYIEGCSYMNIFYPELKTHSSALSNRFYNSLIYKKPMIVTKGQIQGEHAEKYNVGIAISNGKELIEKIREWEKKINFEEYESNCNTLLKQFITDYEIFKDTLKSFVEK